MDAKVSQLVRDHLTPIQNPYIRFPLALLRYPSGDPTKLLFTILHYCMVEVGSRVAEQIGDRAAQEEVVKACAGCYLSKDALRALNLPCLLGARRLNVAFNASVEDGYRITRAHGEIRVWLASQPANEQNTTVNMPLSLYLACMNHLLGKHPDDFLTWNQFRVLCAIASKLGSKCWGECGWREIQARSIGTLTKLPHDAGRDKMPSALTEKQIRRLTGELYLSGRFVRIGGRGEVIYGMGMSLQDLSAKIIDRKSQMLLLRQRREVEESAMKTQISTKLAGLETEGESGANRGRTDGEPRANINRRGELKGEPKGESGANRRANINQKGNVPEKYLTREALDEKSNSQPIAHGEGSQKQDAGGEPPADVEDETNGAPVEVDASEETVATEEAVTTPPYKPQGGLVAGFLSLLASPDAEDASPSRFSRPSVT